MATTFDFGRLGTVGIPEDLSPEEAQAFFEEHGEAMRAGLVEQEQLRNIEATKRQQVFAAEDTLAEQAGSAAAQFGREAVKGVGTAMRGAAVLAAPMAPMPSFFDPSAANRPQAWQAPTQAERLQAIDESALTRAGRATEQFAEEFPVLPYSEQTIPGRLAGAAGTTASLAPAMLAGPAAPGVAGTIYGLQAGQSQADEARRVIDARVGDAVARGDWETARALLDERESAAQLAFATAAPIGAVTEAGLGVVGGLAARKLPIARYVATGIARRAKRAVGPRTGQVAGQAVVGGLTEAAQEASESLLSDVAARAVYDPDRTPGAQMVEEALYGGGVGALFGGAMGYVRGTRVAGRLARRFPEDQTRLFQPAAAPDLAEGAVGEGEVEGEGGAPEGGGPPQLPGPRGPAGLLPFAGGGGTPGGGTPLTDAELDLLDQLETAEDAGLISDEDAEQLRLLREKRDAAKPATRPSRVIVPPFTGPGRDVIITPFTGATKPGMPGRQQLRRAGVEAGLFAQQGQEPEIEEQGRPVGPGTFDEGLQTAEVENVPSPIDEAIMGGRLKRQLNLPENVANAYSLAGSISGRYLGGETVDPDVLTSLDDALPSFLKTLQSRIDSAIDANVNERDVDALIGLHQRLTQFGVERRNDAAFNALQEEQRYQDWLARAAGGRIEKVPEGAAGKATPPPTPTPAPTPTPTPPPTGAVIQSLPQELAEAIAASRRPDVRVEHTVEVFGESERGSAASMKPTSRQLQVLEQGRKVAEQNGWNWPDVEAKAKEQLGLDENWLIPGSREQELWAEVIQRRKLRSGGPEAEAEKLRIKKRREIERTGVTEDANGDKVSITPGPNFERDGLYQVTAGPRREAIASQVTLKQAQDAAVERAVAAPTPTPTPTPPPTGAVIPAPETWTPETREADAMSVGGPGQVTPGDAPNTAVLDRPGGLGKIQVLTGNEWMADAPRDPDVTASGVWVLMEAEDVVSSFQGQKFNQRIQPRIEDTIARQQAADSYGSDLRGHRLADSGTTDTGAIVIDEKGQAISGNNRMRGVRRAIDGSLGEVGTASLAKYKAWLGRNATSFGFTPEQVAGMRHPMAFRLALSYPGVTKMRLAETANDSPVLLMTQIDGAVRVAEAMRQDPKILAMLSPSDTGSLMGKQNEPFMRKVQELSGIGETFQDAGGNLKGEIEDFANQALLAYLFGSSDYRGTAFIIQRAGDFGFKQAIKGIAKNAGLLAQLQGTPYSIGSTFLDAFRAIVDIRSSGMTLEEYVGQSSLGLEGDVDPNVKNMVGVLMGIQSTKEADDFFKFYSESSQKAIKDLAEGGSMFGGSEIPDRGNILGTAAKKASDARAARAEAAKRKKEGEKNEPTPDAATSAPEGAGKGAVEGGDAGQGGQGGGGDGKPGQQGDSGDGTDSRGKKKGRGPRVVKPKTGATVVPPKTKATVAEPTPTPPAGGLASALSEEKQARLAQLRAKLRGKMGQFNVGVDPEIIVIGLEMATLYAEAGARKFAQYARQMKADMPDLWERIKPYLASFWNSAITAFPDAEEVTPSQARAEIAEIDRPTPPPTPPPTPAPTEPTLGHTRMGLYSETFGEFRQRRIKEKAKETGASVDEVRRFYSVEDAELEYRRAVFKAAEKGAVFFPWLLDSFPSMTEPNGTVTRSYIDYLKRFHPDSIPKGYIVPEFRGKGPGAPPPGSPPNRPTGKTAFVEFARKYGLPPAQAEVIFDNYADNGWVSFDPKTQQLSILAGRETERAMREVLGWAVPSEILSLLKGNGLKVEYLGPSVQGPVYEITGKTKEAKDYLRRAGGRYNGFTRSWRFGKATLAALGEILPRAQEGGGRSDLPAASYETDPQLRRIREQADGRPDESGDPRVLRELVSPDTAQLLNAGVTQGIPQDVINEQVEDVGAIVNAYEKGRGLFLLGNDAGTGKTFILGGAIRELRRRGVRNIVYVTVNQDLIKQTQADLAKYGIDGVEFMTYNKFRESDPMPTDALLFDEAHYVKNNHFSQQGKVAQAWMKKARFTVMASATPYEDPTQMAYVDGTGIFKELGGFSKFAAAFGAYAKTDRDGNVVSIQWRRTRTSLKDSKAAREYMRKMGVFVQRSMRLPREQVETSLVAVPTDPEFKAVLDAINSIKDEVIAGIPWDNGITAAWVQNFTKRLLEYSKIPVAIERAKAAMDEGRWPIIFLETRSERSIDIPDLLRRENDYAIAVATKDRGAPTPKRSEFGLPPFGATRILETYMNVTGKKTINIPQAEKQIQDAFGAENVAIFTGTMTQQGAQGDLARWRTSRVPMVLVATMAKGGTGLSLHDKVGNHPTTQINVILPWTGSKVAQVTQRSARYGLKGIARIDWLFADESDTDRALAARVGQRMQTMGALVRGDVPQITTDIAEFNIGEEEMDGDPDGLMTPEEDRVASMPTEPSKGPVAEAIQDVKDAIADYNAEARKLRATPDTRRQTALAFKVFTSLVKLGVELSKFGVTSAAQLAQRAGVRLNGLVEKAWRFAQDGLDPDQVEITEQDRIDAGTMTGFVQKGRAEAKRIEREARANQPPPPSPLPRFGDATTGKTRASRSLFVGQYAPKSGDEWVARAKEWVDAFNGNLLGALDAAVARNPETGMDILDAQTWVLGEILARAFPLRRNPDARTPFVIDERFIERINEARRDNATRGGQAQRAQGMAQEYYSYMNPVLTLLGLIKDRQRKLPFPEIKSEELREWMRGVRKRVIQDMLQETSKADNIVERVFNRTARDLGVNWNDVMASSYDEQANVFRAIYDAIRAHPILGTMPDTARVELANLLGKQFQKKRDEIARKEILKYTAPKASRKVQEGILRALPRILRWANLGTLDDANFRDAVAPMLGVASFDSDIVKEIEQMAQEAQKVSGENRRRILLEMYRKIAANGTVRWGDVLRDYWYASVLSGSRTQVDNGMPLFEGFITAAGLGLASTEKMAMLKGFGSGVAQAISDFWPILWNGEAWRSISNNPDRAPNALEALSLSGNRAARLLANAKFVSRLMEALNHLNGLPLYNVGVIDALVHRGDEALLRRYLSPDKDMIDNARQQAANENTPAHRMKARVREILQEQLPEEVILDARAFMASNNYTNAPKGLAGVVHRLLERAAASESPVATNTGAGFAAKLILGTNFFRYAANIANRYADYMVAPALFRWFRAAKAGTAASEEYREIERRELLVRAAIGSVLAAAAGALFLGRDDDEERDIDITGSLKSLSPERRKRVLELGVKPYTIRLGNEQFSYRQWGFGSVLAVIGALRDRQLYDRENWDQESIVEKFVDASAAGFLTVTDATAISGLTEFLGASNAYRYDSKDIIEKRIPRYAARVAGGFIPNILKEIDAWEDPSIFKAQTGWEFFLQQVPFARRTVGPGPMLNILGEPVRVERYPWSRWIASRQDDAAWETLANLAGKGVFMPSIGKRTVPLDDGTRRDMTREEEYRFNRNVGRAYREWVIDNRRELRTMAPRDAAAFIDKESEEIRNRVAKEMF